MGAFARDHWIHRHGGIVVFFSFGLCWTAAGVIRASIGDPYYGALFFGLTMLLGSIAFSVRTYRKSLALERAILGPILERRSARHRQFRRMFPPSAPKAPSDPSAPKAPADPSAPEVPSELSAPMVTEPVSSSDTSGEECSICLEEGTNVSLPCRHAFHRSCIHDWLMIRDSCPLCRATVLGM